MGSETRTETTLEGRGPMATDDVASRPGMTFRDPEAMRQIRLEAEYDERFCDGGCRW